MHPASPGPHIPSGRYLMDNRGRRLLEVLQPNSIAEAEANKYLFALATDWREVLRAIARACAAGEPVRGGITQDQVAHALDEIHSGYRLAPLARVERAASGPFKFEGPHVVDWAGRRLATVLDDVPYHEREANGHLYAAAPHLLQTLLAIRARLAGDWDAPALRRRGPLHTDIRFDVAAYAAAGLYGLDTGLQGLAA